MKFSVIICTCNRHEKVMELVNQLLGFEKDNVEIVIVDSSDQDNPNVKPSKNLLYHRTSHKNQPFQRFLGFNLSTSNYILYLDDDMEIVHDVIFEKLEKYIEQYDPAGFALKFVEVHKNTSLAVVPKSEIFDKMSLLKKIKNRFTGLPDLPQGKLGMNGNKGKQPIGVGITEIVSGGAFLVKRNAMYKNFNFQMYDLYNEKFGKGEDAITGFTISKQGTLYSVPETLFKHNDQQNSSYSSNLESFGARVMFSRLYLSLEKTRLDESSFLLARIAYHWFALWRILGLALNFLKNCSEKRKSMLRGAWKGWIKSITFKFNSQLTRNSYWVNEMQEEMKTQKNK